MGGSLSFLDDFSLSFGYKYHRKFSLLDMVRKEPDLSVLLVADQISFKTTS